MMPLSLIDFSFWTTVPRKEFVGLTRKPMPSALTEFEGRVAEAIDLAVMKFRTRYYGRVPNEFPILVQLGHRRIATVNVQVLGDRGVMRSWSAQRGTPLYRIWLEWKFKQTGDIVGFYDHLDKPEEDSDNIERIIFRTSIKGLPTLDMVMRELAAKGPDLDIEDSWIEKLRDSVRLRYPV